MYIYVRIFNPLNTYIYIVMIISLGFFFSFFLACVNQNHLHFFVMHLFFSMNYSYDEIDFLLIYQKSTSLSQYCSKKMKIRYSIVFSLTLRTSVVLCIFFITFIKFKNFSTCILILLLKYNRIS